MTEENNGQAGDGGGDGGGDGETKKEQAPPPKSNIKLRKDAQPITVDGEVSAGMDKNGILFPDETNQKAGWYHPRAKEILRLFPDRYIEIKEKG
jgi:hypothetical protein